MHTWNTCAFHMSMPSLQSYNCGESTYVSYLTDLQDFLDAGSTFPHFGTVTPLPIVQEYISKFAILGKRINTRHQPGINYRVLAQVYRNLVNYKAEPIHVQGVYCSFIFTWCNGFRIHILTSPVSCLSCVILSASDLTC